MGSLSVATRSGAGGGEWRRHWLRTIRSLLISALWQQGNAVIQGLCSVIALAEHVGKLLQPARGSGSRASLVLNSWQRERAWVLHLNTLQADRWWVRGSLWSMRSISLARCFEPPSIRNNKGSHCLSGNKGRSQPHRFDSQLRPCHLSRL